MKTARWFGAVVGMLLGMWVMAFAQSWTAPKTFSQGELVTPDHLNTHLRDNITVLRAGGIAISGQGANEIIFSSSASQLTRSSELVWTGDALTITGFINSATAQPAVLAYSTGGTSCTTNCTVDFDTEVYDKAGNFASDTFTAPVAGDYLMCANVDVENQLGVAGTINMRFMTDAGNYNMDSVDLAASGGASLNGCLVILFDAADTAHVRVEAGSATIGNGFRQANVSYRLMP
jgi:hypothetical protein